MIYLLEDDQNIRKLVGYALRSHGFESEGFETPRAFWAAIKKRLPQLVLLDVMLPEEDGFAVLEQLRAKPETRKIPIIMLTAKDSEFDKVTGLDLGADDYVSKPFGMMELLSRIRAVLRRTDEQTDSVSYTLGSLYVCPVKHIVRVDGADIPLALKEYELLCTLLESGGKVLSRDALLTQIWGYHFDGESRTIDVHIRKLRQKLGKAGTYIETVKGLGYTIRGENGYA